MPLEALRQFDSSLPAAERDTASPKRRSRKHDAIIAAAKEVFFEDGYAGASMDKITARAGVSKATIYANFRSKEEILRAVVEAVVAPIDTKYDSEISRIEDFHEWLRRLGLHMARNALLPDIVALERLVVGEALRFPELGELYHRTAIMAPLKLFQPRFEAAIAAGILRHTDSRVALLRFAEWCTGNLRREVVMNLRPCPDDAEIDAFAAEAVDAFLHGYGARD